LLPLQQTTVYLKKISKALVIKLITARPVYTLLYKYSRLKGKDFDEVLAGFTKGFPGADVIEKIRYRPCAANLRLMTKRVINFEISRISKRTETASEILKYIPKDQRVGDQNSNNTFWVLPVESNDPAKLIAQLRRQGIDATAKASSLVKLSANDLSIEGELNLDNLVYIPIHRSVINRVPLA
jgi:dTDP-4-amino-4,6-dideoxygalactose transaminase